MREPTIFPLYEKPESGFKIYRTQITIGIVITVLIIIAHLLFQKFHENESVNFGTLLFFLVYPLITLWNVKQKEKLFIEVSTDVLRFKHSAWAGTIQLQSNEIKFIDIDITDIHVVTTDHRSFIIDVSYAKFSNIELIKRCVKDFKTNP